MDYKKGERVKHPGKPEWGLGEVLEDSRDDKVRIFFTEIGQKTFSLKHVEPIKIVGKEASHPMLDHLRIIEGGESKYQSLQQSKEIFLQNYPDGFYGQVYLNGERSYKVAAHELALHLLGPEQLGELIGQKDYEEICKRALKVVNATNLIFPNEKMALKDGLKESKNMEVFSENLYQLLYGQSSLEERFMSFAGTLEEIGAAKWTIQSYFLFIIFPEKYIFLKPVVTQLAAEISAFEINYRPDLNWKTYKSVLDFSEYFRSEMKDLKPRDMIDIQSFMWCIGPKK